MGEEVGRIPLDLLGHLISGTGETERSIGHPSVKVGLNFSRHCAEVPRAQ
jgi:hypothetical protein